MKNICTYFYLIILSVSLNACNGTNNGLASSDNITVTPKGEDIHGDLYDKMKLKPGNYTIEKVTDSDGKPELLMTISIEITGSIDEGKKFGTLRATLLNENGASFGSNLGKFATTRMLASTEELQKLDDALAKGNGTVDLQLRYLDTDAASVEDAWKKAKETAKHFSVETSY